MLALAVETVDVTEISLPRLALAFLPALIVLVVLGRWGLGARRAGYGLTRMLVQLMVVGYFLTYLFEASSAWPIVLVLAVMVLASSWIALGSLGADGAADRRQLYLSALFAVAVGGGLNLIVVTAGVLQLEPWFLPRYMIPLAGMVFAGSMNSVSLAAERFFHERERGLDPRAARGVALNAALIPIINSLFAVGLVSIPGMMTGQILANVDPLIAARYQIMVMAMLLGSNGLASILFLRAVERRELAT